MKKIDLTWLILLTPSLFNSLMRAKEELKEGKLLTHEEVFKDKDNT